jgi:hypothetical protein
MDLSGAEGDMQKARSIEEVSDQDWAARRGAGRHPSVMPLSHFARRVSAH